MRYIFSFIFLLLFFALNAQKPITTNQIDKFSVQIPDSLLSNTNGISSFINSKYILPKDKARAIFVWITNNIQYDIENIFAINFYQNTNEIVTEVLKSRKGACMHFAELFNDIATKVGIKSYVITGYTKQNGLVDYIPHAWCTAMIDSTWSLFDPTWGSGYIQNAKYIKKMNNYYFMTNPEQLIKSHMPFDPMWELLNYPVTNQEFYENKTQFNKNKIFFNYNDSINKYLSGTEIQQLISSSRRIEKNGVKNSMIFDRLQHNKREIEYIQNKLIIEKQNATVNELNLAVNLYNDGINKLNTFINYRNQLFNPLKSEYEIRKMIEDPEISLDSSRAKLKTIETTDKSMINSIAQLDRSLDEAFINLNEQKVFINKYFNTGKLFRKSLFYKYTWMGIPIGK